MPAIFCIHRACLKLGSVRSRSWYTACTMYATVSLFMRKKYLYRAPSNLSVSITSSSNHMRDLPLLYMLVDRRGSAGSPSGSECLDFDVNTTNVAIQHMVRCFKAIWIFFDESQKTKAQIVVVSIVSSSANVYLVVWGRRSRCALLQRKIEDIQQLKYRVSMYVVKTLRLTAMEHEIESEPQYS